MLFSFRGKQHLYGLTIALKGKIKPLGIFAEVKREHCQLNLLGSGHAPAVATPFTSPTNRNIIVILSFAVLF
jgi:hypothetical protein